MEKIIFITVVYAFLHGPMARAQRLDNKVNVDVSAGIAKTLGSQNIEEKGFVVPSLFNNYQQVFHLGARASYQLLPRFWLGVGGATSRWEDWSYDESELLYANSSSRITTLSPLLKFQTEFRRNGLLKGLQGYGALAPGLRLVTVSLAREVVDIEPQPSAPGTYLESKFNTWGVSAYLGASVAFSQEFSLFAEAGLGYTDVTGPVYADRDLLTVTMSLGLTVKFFKDKRFYLR